MLLPISSPVRVADMHLVGPMAGCAQEVGDLDPCFDVCHGFGMWQLGQEDCDLECASDWFEQCMEYNCGGM